MISGSVVPKHRNTVYAKRLLPTELAQQVVREEAVLAPFASKAFVKIRRQRLVKAILGRDVYCHFEIKGQRLACAFSSEEKKYLLGEAVRDWITEEYGEQDFVWCEVVEGELLYVLVSAGRVEKDVVGLRDLYREISWVRERPIQSRLEVFLHENVRAVLEREKIVVEDSIRPHFINVSIADRLDRASSPRLVAINEIESVKLWNRRWKYVRMTIWVSLLMAVVASGVAAVDWWLSRVPPTVATPDTGPTPSESEYNALLHTPDPADLIRAIHHAHREFLSDRLFGRYWNVVSLTWTRQEWNESVRRWLPSEGTLEVKAALPVVGPDDAASPVALSEELQADILAYAEGRGWRVQLSDRDATFRLPVRVDGRDDEQAGQNRRPLPHDEQHYWHYQRLIEDLRYVGSARVEQITTNRVFTSYPLALELRGAEWVASDTVDWLAERLTGGPVVLESLFLVQEGVSATGQIKFLTVWCSAVDPATKRCAE